MICRIGLPMAGESHGVLAFFATQLHIYTPPPARIL
jgi:hypothetical protein